MNEGPKIYVNVHEENETDKFYIIYFWILLDESVFSQLLTEIDIYIDMTILTDWNLC